MLVFWQNALRRIIEKFTDNVRFCLICNYLSKIIPALQSRCTRFRFGPLNTKQILPRLQHVYQVGSQRCYTSWRALDTLRNRFTDQSLGESTYIHRLGRSLNGLLAKPILRTTRYLPWTASPVLKFREIASSHSEKCWFQDFPLCLWS